MKRNMGKICLWKIPAILAVFGLALAFAGCDNGNGGGSSYEPGHLGNTLNLSGQVYTMEGCCHDGDRSFERFLGTRTVTGVTYTETGRVVLGTGAITGGQLNFSLGTPTAALRSGVGEEGWTINPAATRAASFSLQIPNGRVEREKFVFSGNETSGSAGWISVGFIYVDRDATFRRLGWTNNECTDGECTDDCLDWSTQCRCCWCIHCSGIRWVVEATDLNLRAGWNAFRFTETESWTATSETVTVSFNLGETSGLRWVLRE